MQAFVRLLQLLKSDLVAVVYEEENVKLSSRITDLLKRNGISVAEVIPYDHAALSNTLVESDAHVFLSLVGNRKVRLFSLSHLFSRVLIDFFS